MLAGYGWCVLRASREAYRNVAPLGDAIDRLDDLSAKADAELWAAFRKWMQDHATAELRWTLHEHHGNDSGILLYCVSRNHRASCVWDMLAWIAEHGPGSYGLLYVHDDEDLIDFKSYGRGRCDYSGVFRVHRIANGHLDELDDPFLSPRFPKINPSEYA
jgi:hypothetical protein